MSEPDVIVVGAGPAGLAAGIAAARRGRHVLCLEKNDHPGRKLLMTGGGRCNVRDPARATLDALEAYGRSGRFLRDAFAAFDFAAFLTALDVRTELDPSDGRHYVRGGAARLLEKLLDALTGAGARLVTGSRVTGVSRQATGGFEVETRAGRVAGERLVLATGGMTWQSTGSTGDGYDLARALGHDVDPPRPALGALATTPHFAALAGVTVPGVRLTLRLGGRTAGEGRGDVLFTHRGLSGPAVLDLSLELVRARRTGEAEIVIDWLDGVERTALETWLAGRRRRHAADVFHGSRLGPHLPARLVRELLTRAGIDPARPMDQVSHARLRDFAGLLKATRLGVGGVEDPDRCAVTLGGVATRHVEPKTLQSRIVPGLFFAGELLSPAGRCGGFNLLVCFATGTLAGSSV